MDKIYYQLKLINNIPFGTFTGFPAFTLFSTAYSGQARDRNFINSLEQTLGREITYVNQVHGSKIITASAGGNKGEGDGLVITGKNLGAVFTADCLPIVLTDISGEHTAIVHAGWPGSLAGIAVLAAEKLREASGKEILAAIGPAANSCCYEVGQDLVEKFEKKWPLYVNKVIRKNNDKIFLDLSTFNEIILKAVGVEVFQSQICTICSSNYHSYRRDKTVLRQLSLVGRRI